MRPGRLHRLISWRAIGARGPSVFGNLRGRVRERRQRAGHRMSGSPGDGPVSPRSGAARRGSPSAPRPPPPDPPDVSLTPSGSLILCISQYLYRATIIRYHYCPVGTARIPRLPGVARIRSSRMTQHARAGPGHRAFRWTNARTTVVRENSRTAASSTPSSPERRQGPRRAAWCPASGRHPRVAAGHLGDGRVSSTARTRAFIGLLHEPAGHRPATSTTSHSPGASGSRVAPAPRQSDVAHTNSCVNQ